MKRSVFSFAFLFAFLLVLSSPFFPALAEPFCVEAYGIPKECYYSDPEECRKRAAQMAGICTVNPDLFSFPEGEGSYCLVVAAGVVHCLYSDARSCESEAARNKGICVRNPNRRAPSDPFRYNSEVYY